jgi:predicted TIM-barrel fold metal-dependent hydrolase
LIDDPAFEPVFNYLEENRIPVIGHLGEPKDCWLPEDSMSDPSDVTYYRNNPQYYMYMHPEVPSYDQQIRARDNILKKHPHLDFTGAHLGSLEWSVDELSKRLDTYPVFRVDLAARMFHLQSQSSIDYNKIRNFMIKYQDRILYGTDDEVHDIEGITVEQSCDNLRKGWFNQWLYLATDSVVNNIKGLKLPASVIDKIYFKNADRYFTIKKNQLK